MTEQSSLRTTRIETWPTAEVVEALWEGQLAAVSAVRPALGAIARAVEAAVIRLSRGGRLVYAGAGTSGRISVQDGAELVPTFDWPAERLLLLMAGGTDAFTRSIEGAEDNAEAARADLALASVAENDVVLAVAASGTTPYTLGILEEAGRRGALTIAISNNPDAPLLKAAQHPILADTGAEAIAGSTRMKAGTAQKVILNLISTAIMIRLGRVYRGRMVDMQARNHKLRRRALLMVMELGQVEEAVAEAALAASSWHVKTALLLLGVRIAAEAQTGLPQDEVALGPAHDGDATLATAR